MEDSTPKTLVFLKFYEVASILLGGLTGLLIAIPSSKGLLTVLGLIVGLAIGYRRRKSRIFFYFSGLCVLILLSLIVSQGTPPILPASEH